MTKQQGPDVNAEILPTVISANGSITLSGSHGNLRRGAQYNFTGRKYVNSGFIWPEGHERLANITSFTISIREKSLSLPSLPS
jgi:hypothetical protein